MFYDFRESRRFEFEYIELQRPPSESRSHQHDIKSIPACLVVKFNPRVPDHPASHSAQENIAVSFAVVTN